MRGVILKPLEELDLKEREEVEIILRPRENDLEKKIDDLDKYLATNAPKPFVSRLKKGYKWFTEEYSLKKLGLLKE
jgi:predicted DNA-binding antitoxin AbrB/MazE fold protein